MKRLGKTIKKRLFSGLCALAVMCCAYCAKNATAVAGGGSDTEVSGRIVSSCGHGNQGVCVRLIGAQHNPAVDTALSTIRTDTTDEAGAYHFAHVNIGSYNIQAEQPFDGTRILISGVSVPASGPAAVTVKDDSLRKPATLCIVLPDSISSSAGFVYVPGTLISKPFATGASAVELDSVPQGLLSSIQCSYTGSSSVKNLFANVPIDSSGTVVLHASQTTGGSAIIGLNTTATGAGIAGDVYNFPALVRLTANNFNFSKAKQDGSDLRFTKLDGTPLPYEIERWDASLQAAEIWVKVDTIHGNANSQCMVMKWGDSVTGLASSSAKVFDTANGYIGVWHLGSGLIDATVFRGNGIDSSTADSAGIIGRCRHFDPAHRSFVLIPTAPRFNLTSNITLSAWVRVDSILCKWQAIITKGDNTYRLHCDTTFRYAVFSVNADSAGMPDSMDDLDATTRIDDHRWHLICGVYDGTTMRIYTDGVLENERVRNMPCYVNDSNLVIGDNKRYSPRFFYGSIDEARIMRASMGANWIKLCYMNQKENDQLVLFK